MNLRLVVNTSVYGAEAGPANRNDRAKCQRDHGEDPEQYCTRRHGLFLIVFEKKYYEFIENEILDTSQAQSWNSRETKRASI